MPRLESNRTDRFIHLALLIVVGLLLAPLATSAWASEQAQGEEDPVESTDAADDEVDAAADEQLALGAQIYSQTCSACHQPGGVGITGQFPPLLDNPNIQDDAEYLREVIANGREGEIEVMGVIYDGRMPPFSTLPDDEVDALVGYIQSGFSAPALPEPVAGEVSADRGLPGLANFSYLVAFAIAGGVGFLVLAPRLTSANDRLTMPWLDAWLKTAVIVVGFIVFTVFVPNWAMQTDTVAKLDRVAQDLIGTGLWLAGLVAGIWALWYAHREDRI